MFWHEVGKIQNDSIPRDGWEMAALAIGLGGAIGELWVQDGLLLILALGLSGFAGYRLYIKNIKAGIPYFEQEVLSPYDIVNEKIMLGLRTLNGLDKNHLFSISIISISITVPVQLIITLGIGHSS